MDFAGQIGYALAPMIARGAMLGAEQPVILHLLDIPPAAQALEGVKMELIDAAFPLLDGERNSKQRVVETGIEEGADEKLTEDTTIVLQVSWPPPTSKRPAKASMSQSWLEDSHERREWRGRTS